MRGGCRGCENQLAVHPVAHAERGALKRGFGSIVRSFYAVSHCHQTSSGVVSQQLLGAGRSRLAEGRWPLITLVLAGGCLPVGAQRGRQVAHLCPAF